MTVCVAALCMGPRFSGVPGYDVPTTMIVCAADMMQSAGDLQYEHQQSKYYPFSTAIAALVAGDSTAQMIICDRAQARLPQQGPRSVEEVANLYAEEYQKYRRTIAETLYLRPLGLDLDTFVSRQAEMSPSIAECPSEDIASHMSRLPAG